MTEVVFSSRMASAVHLSPCSPLAPRLSSSSFCSPDEVRIPFVFLTTSGAALKRRLDGEEESSKAPRLDEDARQSEHHGGPNEVHERSVQERMLEVRLERLQSDQRRLGV